MAEQLLMKNKKLLHASTLNLTNSVILSDIFKYDTSTLTISKDQLTGINKIDIEFLYYHSTSDGNLTASGSGGILPINLDQLIPDTYAYFGLTKSVDDVAISAGNYGLYTFSVRVRLTTAGNLEIRNWNKGFFTVGNFNYSDRTSSAGYGFKRIIGYKPINLVDVYNKSEVYTKEQVDALTRPVLGTITPVGTLGSGAKIQRINKTIFLDFEIVVNKSVAAWGNVGTIAIPDTTFPTSKTVYTAGITDSGGVYSVAGIQIYTNLIRTVTALSSGNFLRGSISWVQD